MISGKEVKVIDKSSEYFGVPTITLMENAGKGVADFVIKKLKADGKKIIIFCGLGNNGGDGLVAARYLSKSCRVSVFLTGEEVKTENAKQNFSQLQKYDIPIHYDMNNVDSLLTDNDIVIDAMLGIGLKGKLREPYHFLVKTINALSDKIILSVDVPTGLGTRLAIQPEYTVTFHDIKEEMSSDTCGKIHIVDIGMPADAVTYVGPGELSVYYPRPKKQSHKGENGIVLIIGGGPYTGAPALSGMAALRTGADLVFIATPKRCWQTVSSYSPNFIVKALSSDLLTSEDIPTITELLKKCNTVVIGPGLGSSKKTQDAILELIEIITSQKKSLVIDADAIPALASKQNLLKNHKIVLTPHLMEFKKLTGIDLSDDIKKRTETVCQWAKKLDTAIFLKAPIDILTNGEDIKLNKVHNEAMTVGGTGDVLAGIIGALLSKGVTPYNAIRMAAFLNGEAGNQAFIKKSYGLLATDVIDELPAVLKKYL